MSTSETYITPSSTPKPKSGSNSSVKPTLLTFHGSGSNATIHTIQLARLSRYLRPHFNIIDLEAPFPSAAGPGVLPFFEGCGPFKRWVPPTEKLTLDGMKTGAGSNHMPPEVESLITSTIATVKSEGGVVAGVIGFSQGTRIVAGLLRAGEIVRGLYEGKEGGDGVPENAKWLLDFKFGLSVCGSYPPALLPSAVWEGVEGLGEVERKKVLEGKVRRPTLHVQGKQDEWEWAGKLLIESTYEVGEGMSRVDEYAMGHHYPVRPEDTEEIRDFVLETWLDVQEAEKS